MSNIILHERDCKEKLHLGVNDTQYSTLADVQLRYDKDAFNGHTKAHLCDKDFKQDIHMGVLSEQNQYNCVCGKHFNRKHKLMNRTRMHTAEKSYKCKYCGKQFSQNS